MNLLRLLEHVFFYPGDLVRRSVGITLDQDGGIIRSFVNMVFWGAVFLVPTLWFLL